MIVERRGGDCASIGTHGEQQLVLQGSGLLHEAATFVSGGEERICGQIDGCVELERCYELRHVPDECLPKLLDLFSSSEHDDLSHAEIPQSLERNVVAPLVPIAASDGGEQLGRGPEGLSFPLGIGMV